MKSKKFLAFALVTATLALSIVPSAFAVTDSGTATIQVAAGTPVSFLLNGDMEAPQFSLSPNADGQSTTTTLSRATTSTVSTNDMIKVVDAEGSGHSVDLKLDAAVWTASNTGASDLTVTQTSTAFANSAYLVLKAPTPSTAVDQLDAAGCPATSATATYLESQPVLELTTGYQNIISNTSTCSATWYYTPTSFRLKGPSNKLFTGSYTIAATAILYNTP